jgi:DNA-binding NarL/FixJ family response regulator
LIHVVLVARHYPARVGLRALLESDPRVVVVDEAVELFSLTASSLDDADVVLLDGQGLGAADLPGELTQSMPGIVLLGGPISLQRALVDAGEPVGLLGADVSADQIHAGLAAVAAGLSVFETGARGRTPVQPMGDEDVQPADLTPRERAVLELVAAGFTNKGIAVRLGISEHTVKFHLASVLSKLDASSRAEAVARAARLGIIAL